MSLSFFCSKWKKFIKTKRQVPTCLFLTQNDFQYEILTLKPYTIHIERTIRSTCLTTTLPNRCAKVRLILKLQRFYIKNICSYNDLYFIFLIFTNIQKERCLTTSLLQNTIPIFLDNNYDFLGFIITSTCWSSLSNFFATFWIIFRSRLFTIFS